LFINVLRINGKSQNNAPVAFIQLCLEWHRKPGDENLFLSIFVIDTSHLFPLQAGFRYLKIIPSGAGKVTGVLYEGKTP
jgi:hypothetical protein